jgi:hypothetical protein
MYLVIHIDVTKRQHSTPVGRVRTSQREILLVLTYCVVIQPTVLPTAVGSLIALPVGPPARRSERREVTGDCFVRFISET